MTISTSKVTHYALPITEHINIEYLASDNILTLSNSAVTVSSDPFIRKYYISTNLAVFLKSLKSTCH